MKATRRAFLSPINFEIGLTKSPWDAIRLIPNNDIATPISIVPQWKYSLKYNIEDETMPEIYIRTYFLEKLPYIVIWCKMKLIQIKSTIFWWKRSLKDLIGLFSFQLIFFDSENFVSGNTNIVYNRLTTLNPIAIKRG